MRKRKALIVMLIFLLILLVVYLILISSVKQDSFEASVSFPYTNWMSKPSDNSSKDSDNSGVIVFKQNDSLLRLLNSKHT